MLICFWISVSLPKTEVNHVNQTRAFINSDEEVIWLDISVNEEF